MNYDIVVDATAATARRGAETILDHGAAGESSLVSETGEVKVILARQVFHAKYGRGDELVALFKQVAERLPGTPWRMLTDLSGQSFTVVVESGAASLAEWEKGFAEMIRDQALGEIFGKTVDVIDTSHREFYTIVT